jgi:phosphoribosylformylglycinamidine synthase
VLEAVRNLACVGAEPRALVNCLNFGNPEHPEVMWQFSEVVDGMSEACRALDLPVVGGTVSFYNESRGKDIDPTPVAGVVGVVPELRRCPGPCSSTATASWCSASPPRARRFRVGHAPRPARRCPPRPISPAAALHAVVRDLVNRRAVHGVHDCAAGLAVHREMAVAGGVGATLTSPAPGLTPALAWFSESPSRVVFSVAPDREIGVVAAAINAGVAAVIVGRAGGDRIEAEGAFSVTVAGATWRGGRHPRHPRHPPRPPTDDR